MAVGNAGGKGGTPTSTGGSVTALGQSILATDELDGTSEHLHGLIQVNADVEAGDSGGSLVDSSGQVIGMDTAAEHQFSLRPRPPAATPSRSTRRWPRRGPSRPARARPTSTSAPPPSSAC